MQKMEKEDKLILYLAPAESFHSAEKSAAVAAADPWKIRSRYSTSPLLIRNCSPPAENCLPSTRTRTNCECSAPVSVQALPLFLYSIQPLLMTMGAINLHARIVAVHFVGVVVVGMEMKWK